VHPARASDQGRSEIQSCPSGYSLMKQTLEYIIVHWIAMSAPTVILKLYKFEIMARESWRLAIVFSVVDRTVRWIRIRLPFRKYPIFLPSAGFFRRLSSTKHDFVSPV
jgi:hypothetical protein